MPEHEFDPVSKAIRDLESGDSSAADRLLTLVYGELRALASAYFRRQVPGLTLQPTALVHEAYLKMVGSGERTYRSRAHFMAVAAQAMRQILVDRARRRRTKRHGGGFHRVGLDDPSITAASADRGGGASTGGAPNGGIGDGAEDIDLVALDEALRRLAHLDERKARIVELRFFSGMSIEETADLLGIARSTVTEEWRLARAWIARELGPREGRP
ncbi:MAG: sigma-70 family RNA polymerase sigma factor [Phycisphaerae bacterium]|nr:sigma-70 family RNA polymerase sigma factor [Phycisphaerae bacterium]